MYTSQPSTPTADRAGLDLLDKRIGCQAPRISCTDHRIDGYSKTLLRAVRSVIDVLATRPADNQDI
jgi:hypothetical protein